MTNHYVTSKCIVGFLLLWCCAITSCGYKLGFPWTQTKTVKYNETDFASCVPNAIESVQGVSINREHSRSSSYVLNVAFKKPIPGFGFEVQMRENNELEIIFISKESHDAPEERDMIIAVIDSIAAAIQHQCPAEKPVTNP